MTVAEFVYSNPGSLALAALLGIFYFAMFIFIWLQDRRIVAFGSDDPPEQALDELASY